MEVLLQFRAKVGGHDAQRVESRVADARVLVGEAREGHPDHGLQIVGQLLGAAFGGLADRHEADRAIPPVRVLHEPADDSGQHGQDRVAADGDADAVQGFLAGTVQHFLFVFLNIVILLPLLVLLDGEHESHAHRDEVADDIHLADEARALLGDGDQELQAEAARALVQRLRSADLQRHGGDVDYAFAEELDVVLHELDQVLQRRSGGSLVPALEGGRDHLHHRRHQVGEQRVVGQGRQEFAGGLERRQPDGAARRIRQARGKHRLERGRLRGELVALPLGDVTDDG